MSLSLASRRVLSWLLLAVVLGHALAGQSVHRSLHLQADMALLHPQAALASDEAAHTDPAHEGCHEDSHVEAGGCVWCLAQADSAMLAHRPPAGQPGQARHAAPPAPASASAELRPGYSPFAPRAPPRFRLA